MNNELEMRIRERAHAMWEGESRPDGLAEQHWLEAEREVTGEAAPARGTAVEKKTDAAKTA
jgi:hypothetical protein